MSKSLSAAPVASAVPMGTAVETPYARMGGGIGVWSDGLFSCCNDFKLCCCSLFCLVVPVAQLYQRVNGQRVCGYIVLVVFAISCAAGGVSLWCRSQVECHTAHRGDELHCEMAEGAPSICTSIDGLGSISALIMLILFCIVRKEVRQIYNIAPSCCGPLDDFCCACCCLVCLESCPHSALAARDCTSA